MNAPLRHNTFGEIRRPQLSSEAMKVAAIAPEGEERLAAGLLEEFDASNEGGFPAQTVIPLQDEKIARLKKQVERINRQIGQTDIGKIVVARDQSVPIPLFHRLSAGALLCTAGAGLAMGVTVGGNYVVQSGHPLYALDPNGAYLFLGVGVFAASILKAFDATLTTDLAKNLLLRAMFAIAITAFGIWAACMAIVFAPTSAGVDLLLSAANGGDGHAASVLLVAAHLVVDMAGSFIVFIGAERILLAGHTRVFVRNPAYIALTEIADEIQARIEAEAEARANAEDFLFRLDAARNCTAASARFEIRRAAAKRAQLQAAASAAAGAQFLDS